MINLKIVIVIVLITFDLIEAQKSPIEGKRLRVSECVKNLEEIKKQSKQIPDPDISSKVQEQCDNVIKGSKSCLKENPTVIVPSVPSSPLECLEIIAASKLKSLNPIVIGLLLSPKLVVATTLILVWNLLAQIALYFKSISRLPCYKG